MPHGIELATDFGLYLGSKASGMATVGGDLLLLLETSANIAYDSTPENALASAAAVEAEEEEEDFVTAIMEEELYNFVSAIEDHCSYYYDTHGGTAADTTTAASSVGDCPSTPLFSSGDRVYIQSGTHSGKMAIFVKNKAQRVAVKLEDSVVQAICQHVPNAAGRVENVTASKLHRTLFGVIFGQDAVFFDMDTASLAKLPKKIVIPQSDHCQTYFLTGVKLHEKAKKKRKKPVRIVNEKIVRPDDDQNSAVLFKAPSVDYSAVNAGDGWKEASDTQGCVRIFENCCPNHFFHHCNEALFRQMLVQQQPVWVSTRIALKISPPSTSMASRLARSFQQWKRS